MQQRASTALLLLTTIGVTLSRSFSAIPFTVHVPVIAPGTLISLCRCNGYVDNALVCKPEGYCSPAATRIGGQSLTPAPFEPADAESSRWPVPASTRLIPRRPRGTASGGHDRRAPGAPEARRRQRS